MKSFIFASFALAAYAAPVADDEIPANAWSAQAPQGFKINARLDESKPIDNAKRKEILYGPYTLPAEGMISKINFPAEKPCTNCYVTAMQATIKHPDGKEALTSEGFWLHHTVLVGGLQGIWAAGNERPTLRLNSEYKYGIEWPFGPFGLNIDLMSEAKVPANLSMSILYEYIEKDSPEGKLYKPSYMHWNQIGNPAARVNEVYTFDSWEWTSPINGKLLYAIGHMHDGGTDIKLMINDKMVCKSVMRYGGRPGYGGMDMASNSSAPAAPAAPEAPMAGMSHSHSRRDGPHGHGGHGGDMGKMLHISDPGLCENFGEIKKGDKMKIQARYDSTKYPLMTHNGQAERLMGNMRVYIGPTDA